jgi:hypothetical protein
MTVLYCNPLDSSARCRSAADALASAVCTALALLLMVGLLLPLVSMVAVLPRLLLLVLLPNCVSRTGAS